MGEGRSMIHFWDLIAACAAYLFILAIVLRYAP